MAIFGTKGPMKSKDFRDIDEIYGRFGLGDSIGLLLRVEWNIQHIPTLHPSK